MRSRVYFKRLINKKSARAFTLVELLVASGISMVLMVGLLLTVNQIARYSKRITLLVYTQRESNHAQQTISLSIMSGSEVKFFDPDGTPFTLLDLPSDGIYDDKSGGGGVDWTNVRKRDGLALRVDLNANPTPLEGDDSWQAFYYDDITQELFFMPDISDPTEFKIIAKNVRRFEIDIPVFNVPNVGQQNDLVALKYKVLIVGNIDPSFVNFLHGNFEVTIDTSVKLRNTKDI